MGKKDVYKGSSDINNINKKDVSKEMSAGSSRHLFSDCSIKADTENREAYWDYLYKTDQENPLNDNWLECYMHLFKKEDRILELGCGEGLISENLLRNSFNVLSTDISECILEKFKSRVPQASVQKLDINEKFPFKDNSFNIVIADLCLHYFTSDETSAIISEIKRVLSDSGYLFARVNSDKDRNYGAGEGIEIEKGFYNMNGHLKRFFSRDMVKDFFNDWSSLSVSEKTTSKYVYVKHILQIIAGK